MLATLLYLTIQVDSPLWVILLASGVSGLGPAMFFPSNNSAVMANARPGSYGSVSGVLRTVQNVGILMNFVVAISVAAASIPRDVAFQVFIGTTNLVGGVSEGFITGIHSALTVSLGIFAIAAVMSWFRGEDARAARQKKRTESPGQAAGGMPVRPRLLQCKGTPCPCQLFDLCSAILQCSSLSFVERDTPVWVAHATALDMRIAAISPGRGFGDRSRRSRPSLCRFYSSRGPARSPALRERPGVCRSVVMRRSMKVPWSMKVPSIR